MDISTKHLVRSRTDRVIAGVCGGLAAYFAIDATIIRLLFVFVAFAGGSSVLVYILLWIFMPNEGQESLPLESHERWQQFGSEVKAEAQSVAGEFRGNGTGSASLGDRRTLIAIIIVLFGALLLVKQFAPFAWLHMDLFWPLAVIVVGILILKRR